MGTTPSACPCWGARPSPTGERGWIGGFGVLPGHRGRGLSVQLMREHLDLLRASGPLEARLEVLTQNWAAKSYERAGFTTTRRLTVLMGALAGTGGPSPARWVPPALVPDLAGQLDRLHTAYPAAWVRESVAVLASTTGLECLCLGSLDNLDAVLLVREEAGVLRVVEGVARDAAAARAVVAGLARDRGAGECRLVNEPDGSPLALAFADAGLVEVMAQHEMRWHA